MLGGIPIWKAKVFWNTGGEVRVNTTDAHQNLACSSCAVHSWWRKGYHSHQLIWLLQLAWVLTLREKISPQRIHEEFSKIDEYKEMFPNQLPDVVGHYPHEEQTADYSQDLLDLERVLVREPELSIAGFGCDTRQYPTARAQSLHIAAERLGTLCEPTATMFAQSRSWLAKQHKLKRASSGYNSYHLKHIAEREMRTYIGNGIMIAAALAENVLVQREKRGPNAMIGIKLCDESQRAHDKYK